MGLFNSLIKGIVAIKGTTARATMSEQNDKHPAARPINIDGDCENTVFTYIGVALKGVRKGNRVLR